MFETFDLRYLPQKKIETAARSDRRPISFEIDELKETRTIAPSYSSKLKYRFNYNVTGYWLTYRRTQKRLAVVYGMTWIDFYADDQNEYSQLDLPKVLELAHHEGVRYNLVADVQVRPWYLWDGVDFWEDKEILKLKNLDSKESMAKVGSVYSGLPDFPDKTTGWLRLKDELLDSLP